MAGSGKVGRIPRAEMPQVRGIHHGAFASWLEGLGIGHARREVPAATLVKTQEEICWEKVAGMVTGAKPVLVSSDGFVLDGHHHWAAAARAGEKVPVIEFACGIEELLGRAWAWEAREGGA